MRELADEKKRHSTSLTININLGDDTELVKYGFTITIVLAPLRLDGIILFIKNIMHPLLFILKPSN